MNNKPISYHFIVYFQQYINPQSPLSFIHDSKKDSVQHFEFSDDQRNRIAPVLKSGPGKGFR